MNNFPDEVSSHVRYFADDTALYLTIEGEDDSRTLLDLDKLSVWESRWDMDVPQPIQIPGGTCWLQEANKLNKLK